MSYRVMSNIPGARATLLVTAANNFAPSVLATGGETISGLIINTVWMGSNTTGSFATIARGANTALIVNAGTEIIDLAMSKIAQTLDASANVNITFSAGSHTLLIELQKISNREA